MTLRKPLLLILAISLTACSGSGGPYTAPATTAGDDGWQMYVDAPTVDADDAERLDPEPLDSPEAAVVKFLASHVRGDDQWKQTRPVNMGDRGQRAFDQWQDWDLESFQLRGRKPYGDGSRAWVRVHFVISANGDTDEGEDEFDVVNLPTLGWRVASPPT